jgi:hypothetical protein
LHRIILDKRFAEIWRERGRVSVEIYENPFSNLMIFHQHQAPVENLTLVNLAEAEELFPAL